MGTSASGNAHFMAIEGNERKMKVDAKSETAFESLIFCGLTVIKTKSAGQSFEQQISMLVSQNVDVGTIGHSRYVHQFQN